jgi:hypothetical protein
MVPLQRTKEETAGHEGKQQDSQTLISQNSCALPQEIQ